MVKEQLVSGGTNAARADIMDRRHGHNTETWEKNMSLKSLLFYFVEIFTTHIIFNIFI